MVIPGKFGSDSFLTATRNALKCVSASLKERKIEDFKDLLCTPAHIVLLHQPFFSRYNQGFFPHFQLQYEESWGQLKL